MNGKIQSHTSPSMFHCNKLTDQLTANTQFTLAPIKIDIFVEKSKMEIQKHTIKVIKKPSLPVD